MYLFFLFADHFFAAAAAAATTNYASSYFSLLVRRGRCCRRRHHTLMLMLLFINHIISQTYSMYLSVCLSLSLICNPSQLTAFLLALSCHAIRSPEH